MYEEYKNSNVGLDGGASLPFDAPIFYWMRGEPNAPKGNTGVRYYGGWACDPSTMIEPVPSVFALEDFQSSTGQEYQAYAARHLHVAIIAKRQRWVTDESGHGRGHVQILAFAAVKTKGENAALQPWAPVVMSAKSTSAMALESEIRRWEQVTRMIRRQEFDNIPAWSFYLTIGTFGQDRLQVEVGKTKKNFITPPRLYDQQLTASSLGKRLVDVETWKKMGELRDLAEEWLQAWKQPQQPQQPQQDYYEPGEAPF